MVNTSKYTPEQLRELVFTEEEKAQLARAKTMPLAFDPDCPPVTPARTKDFRRARDIHRITSTR